MINASEVADVMRDAVGIAIRLAGPALVLSLLVVIAVLLVGGGWMLETLQDYTKEIFALIAG